MAITDPASRLETTDPVPRSRWDGARMTLEEFLALSEDSETALEFDDGLVIQKVPPQADHGFLAKKLTVAFTQSGEDHQLGLVFVEKRIVTSEWSPVPDVSYVRKERIKPESRRRLGKLDFPPDIAVEILSPDQTVRELLQKCTRYAEIGVPVSLVVDADDETIYAIRPGQMMRVLRGDDRIDLDDVLPGFDLTVQGLFDSIVPDWLVDEAAPEA
jgi:Uma2 family endonuclease